MLRHAPSVLLPTKGLYGGDLVQEAGDSLCYQHGSRIAYMALPNLPSGCTDPTPLTKLLFCSLPWGHTLCHHLLTLPAGSSSLPISIHTHICLSSPWMFRLFLVEPITKCSMARRNSGGSRNKAGVADESLEVFESLVLINACGRLERYVS